MSHHDLARRLEALEAHAAEETGALYDSLLESLTDDELDGYIAAIGGIPEELQALTDDELERRAAEQKLTQHDYTRLRAWLENRRASRT